MKVLDSYVRKISIFSSGYMVVFAILILDDNQFEADNYQSADNFWPINLYGPT